MENNSPPTLSVTAFTVSSKINSSEFSTVLDSLQELKNGTLNEIITKLNLNEKI
jgi:hypothetical protein